MKPLFILFAFLLCFSANAVNFVIPEINTKFDTIDSNISAINTLADGKIYLGNASNAATEVTLSGDVTTTNAGVTAIGNGKVLEPMLQVPTADALHARRVARVTYDFSVDGGTIGTIGSGITLPDNAIITSCWYDVSTTFTSATDAATVALNIPTDGDLQAAVAISDGGNPYDAGLIACDTKGTDNDDPSTFIKTTAAREISFVIAVEDLTAGKLQLFLEYVVSDQTKYLFAYLLGRRFLPFSIRPFFQDFYGS